MTAPTTAQSKSKMTEPVQAEHVAKQGLNGAGANEAGEQERALQRYRAFVAAREGLPTFSDEVGWLDVYNPEMGEYERLPLTLFELLYPVEEDIGVVQVSQSFLHEFWVNILLSIFRAYLDPQQWFVFGDVNMYWHRGLATSSCPDVAVVPGGNKPLSAEVKSYHIGSDAPVPSFIVEVTSKETRGNDLHSKVLHYAAMGVREYLIIDIEPPADEDWRLFGYRLTESDPFYQPIAPDADGSLTFETVGLRFQTIKSKEIVVYNATTGERLLKPSEQRTRAESAEERAEAEATARRKIADENEALKAEVERLKAKIEKN